MLRNKMIQRIVRMYPFEKGYYRLANAMLKFTVPATEEIPDLHGKFRFKIDLSSGCLQREKFLFFAKNYELPTQNYLKKSVKPGMTVLDVGAHTGFFTILFADLVGEEGRVYSFEPCRRHVKLLKENISANGLHWVNISPMALSEKTGRAVLHLNPVNDGGHSLADLSDNRGLIGRNSNKLTEYIETTTLDKFVNEKGIRNIDVMKIDIEGAETLFLEGAVNTLSSGMVAKIICETGTQAQRLMGKTERDLRNIFYSHGFRSYFIGETLSEFGPEQPVRRLSNILYTKEGL